MRALLGVLARLTVRLRAWHLARRDERHRRAYARAVKQREGQRLAMMLSAPKADGSGRWFQ